MTRRITVRSGSVPRKVSPPASAASAAGADTDAIHDNVDGEIILVTEKVSPVGADVLLIEDSAASNAKKRVQITNLPGDFADNQFSVFNAGDVTKILELDVSSVSTGTTRTLIVPDKNGTIGIDGALPVKTDTGDPGSPFEGQIYVNTFDNKVRVYADGAWRDLVTWV